MVEDEHRLEEGRGVLRPRSFSLSLSLSLFFLSLFFLSFFLSLCHSLFSSIPFNLLLGLIIDSAPPFPTLQSFLLDTLFFSSLFFSVFFFVLICFVGQLFPDVRGRTSLGGGQMWQCQPL